MESIIEPRLWVKIVGSLKGRATEACDPGLHERYLGCGEGMDVDEEDGFRRTEGRKRDLWRRLDRDLKAVLSRVKAGGTRWKNEQQEILADGLGDVGCLIEFIRISHQYGRESDLKVCFQPFVLLLNVCLTIDPLTFEYSLGCNSLRSFCPSFLLSRPQTNSPPFRIQFISSRIPYPLHSNDPILSAEKTEERRGWPGLGFAH